MNIQPRLILTTSLLLGCILFSKLETLAYPCNEIDIHFVNHLNDKVLEENIRLKWSYNKRCPNHDQRTDLFVLDYYDIKEQLISSDTIKGFQTSISSEKFNLEGLTIIAIRELGKDTNYWFHFKTITDLEIPSFSNKAAEINFYLKNGFFLNAFEKFHQLNRLDLTEQFETQYEILFPEFYPGNRTSFNTYLPVDLSIVKLMPFVSGFDDFLQLLNKKTKKEYIKAPGYEISLTVSPDNQIISFDVFPDSKKELFRSLIDKLSFHNQYQTDMPVTLQIGRTKDGRRYLIKNKRMLTDPSSKSFKKTFAPKGAIH